MKTRRSRSRSTSSTSSFRSLSELLVQGKSVVFLCGAGLSAASGIPTFRGTQDSVWSTTIMKIGTRKAFLKVGAWTFIIYYYYYFLIRITPDFLQCTNHVRVVAQDPVSWYNDYWLQKYTAIDHAKPNAAHFALAAIAQAFPKVSIAWNLIFFAYTCFRCPYIDLHPLLFTHEGWYHYTKCGRSATARLWKLPPKKL